MSPDLCPKGPCNNFNMYVLSKCWAPQCWERERSLWNYSFKLYLFTILKNSVGLSNQNWYKKILLSNIDNGINWLILHSNDTYPEENVVSVCQLVWVFLHHFGNFWTRIIHVGFSKSTQHVEPCDTRTSQCPIKAKLPSVTIDVVLHVYKI